MDVSTKLAILADAAKYDASCASSGTTKRNSRDGGLGSTTGAGICHSYTPDGRCVSLLKILLTNFCIYDCQYCINRISSDVRRARFTPEEVVNLTLDFYRRNYIEGLFLSSGIIRNPDYTMEQVVKVAQTLRQEHKFRGYIHLKTIPEASPDLIAQAGRWADRISINVELPTPQDLDRLAPEKNLTRIRSTMGVIRDRISEGKAEVRQSRLAPPFAPAGQSTQMIIGATPTPDRQILEQASSLYGEQKLRRVYYSAFSPIPHASKNLPLVAPPLVREHRLYQADWLLRFYGFSVGELTTPEAPDLPLGIDPKLAWALRHPEQFPVDLQRAPREMLLRIPGLGVRNVDRLLQVRRWHRVTLADLARLRISLKKVQPFITTVDYKPKIVGGQRWASSIQPVKQMELFAPEPRLQRSNIIMLRQITFAPHFRGWQTAARRALSSDWRPEEILWQELHDDQPLLDLAAELEPAAASASPIKTPKSFIEMARRVACHFDPARWSLLYRILWRITHGERHLLEIVVDPDVQKLSEMDKSVRRDVHKMRAFVRFRAVEHDGVKWYVAWFESQCHIVELNAPFFVDRFANMPWSILTPDLCAHWDEKNLTFTEGVSRSAAPTEDAAESLWIQYYSSIFNPARVKVHAMQKEMPKLYWKNLPEAAVIPALLNKAPSRVMEMIDMSQKNSATPATHPAVVPRTTSLKVLRDAAHSCKACPLYRDATQVVFGEGPTTARVVLLGEQPGDSEDRAGRPFIGPAGQLLDRALQEAGLNRADTYVTNAVKHFKFELRGKRRLHKSPSPREIAACRPWLMAEMQLIKPQILVCLGASAAHSVFGRTVKVLSERGTFSPTDFSPLTFVTVHPSSLLRAPDEEARAHQYQLFLHDLRQVAHRLLS